MTTGMACAASPAPVGLALGGARDVVAARPRARLQPFRPVRPSGLALVGREPHVAPDLPADAGRAAPRQTGHLPDARAVADLDLDDPAFLFRQVRTCFPHRCNTPSFGYLDNLQSNGCCTFN